MSVLNEIRFKTYSEEQWDAIRREFGRVKVNPDTIILEYSSNSVRESLEDIWRIHLLLTQVLSEKYKFKREIAQKAVKQSQRLRATVQDLELKGDLISRLERLEDVCNEDIIPPRPAEEIDVDTLVRAP